MKAGLLVSSDSQAILFSHLIPSISSNKTSEAQRANGSEAIRKPSREWRYFGTKGINVL